MTLELRLRLYQGVESHRTAVDSQRDRQSCGSCLERIETIKIPYIQLFPYIGRDSPYSTRGEDMELCRRNDMKEAETCA